MEQIVHAACTMTGLDGLLIKAILSMHQCWGMLCSSPAFHRIVAMASWRGVVLSLPWGLKRLQTCIILASKCLLLEELLGKA